MIIDDLFENDIGRRKIRPEKFYQRGLPGMQSPTQYATRYNLPQYGGTRAQNLIPYISPDNQTKVTGTKQPRGKAVIVRGKVGNKPFVVRVRDGSVDAAGGLESMNDAELDLLYGSLKSNQMGIRDSNINPLKNLPTSSDTTPSGQSDLTPRASVSEVKKKDATDKLSNQEKRSVEKILDKKIKDITTYQGRDPELIKAQFGAKGKVGRTGSDLAAMMASLMDVDRQNQQYIQQLEKENQNQEREIKALEKENDLEQDRINQLSRENEVEQRKINDLDRENDEYASEINQQKDISDRLQLTIQALLDKEKRFADYTAAQQQAQKRSQQQQQQQAQQAQSAPTVQPAEPVAEVKRSQGMPKALVVTRDENENIILDEAGKDACYHKVRRRYKVWPSAYASGALVQCRKKGAANWGTGGKKK